MKVEYLTFSEFQFRSKRCQICVIERDRFIYNKCCVASETCLRNDIRNLSYHLGEPRQNSYSFVQKVEIVLKNAERMDLDKYV